MQQLAHGLMDRAVNGVEVEHFYHGELVAKTRRFDNRLSRWLIENPWKVGRMQMAREWSAGAFDALLERIEWASLGWEEDEALPGPGWPDDSAEEAEARQSRFSGQTSWYAAQTHEAEARKSGNGQGFRG